MKKPAFTAIRSSAQAGFTLIELIVVIVILGILAATALPKFAGLSGDARVAALSAARGALQSTVSMVHGQSLVTPSATEFKNEGVTITLVNGYPSATLASANGAGLTEADYAITPSDAGAAAGDNTPTIPPKSMLIVPKSISDTPSGKKCYLMYTEAANATSAPTVAQTGTATDCK